MGKSKIRIRPGQSDAIPQFERMLAELSAGFINLPATDVDRAIDDALRRIAKLVGVDRVQQIQFSRDGKAAHVTNSGAVEGVQSVPRKPISDLYPWVLEQLYQGLPVIIADVDALPADAKVDQASFRRAGVRSNLSMPLHVAGRVEGAIAFGCLRRERDWPHELVVRIGWLADVFANALAHKHSQEELDAAMVFERLVSDLLAALLTKDRESQDRVIEEGLGKIAQKFGAERATLWPRATDSDEFEKTHRWLGADVPTPPDGEGARTLPWISAELAAGRMVRFESIASLPREAHADLPALRSLGIRSALIVPLAVSDAVVGALSFATAQRECPWPDALVPRVKLVGEVLANLLARRAAERREQQAQAQAAHAARVGTMGVFAASLIHELTQPLAASLANAESAAELLDTASPDLDEVRAAVDDIVTDDRRVGALIQQLRRFLRRGESEKIAFDLHAVLADVTRLVAGEAAEKRIELSTTVTNALPALVGDRVQIHQVLLNLVLNAFDAVAATGAAPRRVSVSAGPHDGGVLVEVHDNGHGMDAETLSRVFQPFFTTKPKGMGLGLSISRSLVAAHGGTLSAGSQRGRGTTMRLTLPAKPPYTARPACATPPRSATTGTVFVIDDEPSMRRALERQLRTAGYRIESFESAEAFLQRPPASGVACIVSDMRMPGQSGLELQAALAGRGSLLPIVFVSGHGDVPTTVHALKAGAVSVLAKPFTKTELVAAVEEALMRSGDATASYEREAAINLRHEALTPREREVFALVASGLLNKVIGDRLGAAEATIKIHRGRVMEKMGAASVADLVRMAESLGVSSREKMSD